jgi:hypothetical protein
MTPQSPNSSTSKLRKGTRMELEGLTRIKADCIWESPELPIHLAHELRHRLETLIGDLKTAGVPIAPSITPFERRQAVRPKGHQRAYYLKLPRNGNHAGGHIAIKGTEPALVDQLKLLACSELPFAWTANNLSSIDFFPIVEHKAPLVLTTEEAITEANIGCELQSKYALRYGELPYLPLPLAVFKLPAKIVDNAQSVLQPLLSPFAEEIVRRLLAGGACVLVYYYPAAPFPRVRHVSQELGNAGASRLLQLRSFAHVEPVIERWIRLFTRVLALGYLPATPSQSITGQAVQAQNVIVGGGFVDLGSIRPIAGFRSERDFLESYSLSLLQLANTVAVYLFAGMSEKVGLSAPEVFSNLYCYELLSRAIAEDTEMFGDSFDRRLKELPPFSRNLTGWVELAERFQRMPQQETLQATMAGGMSR